MKRVTLLRCAVVMVLAGFFLFLADPAAFCNAVPAWSSDASAVYRLIEKDYTVHSDGSYTLVSHVKIDILTYKGKKDHADFKYPYNQAYQTVEILSARTLTKDGKSIPVTPKEIHDINAPEDVRATLYSRQRVKVVNFPSVEPGTTVEITLKVTSQKGFWAMECFRLYDPVARKIVRLTFPSGVDLKVKLPRVKLEHAKKKAGKTVTYHWEARNVPRRVREPNLPPIENQDTCLFLTTLRSWKDAVHFFADCLPEGGPLDGGTVPEGKTPDELYVAFMKQVIPYSIDFFHTALRFQTPGETLKKGFGSSMDLAILFYHLLKKKGYSPSYLLANTDGVMLAPFETCPFPPLFDDVMVRCEGKIYAFYAKDLPPGYGGLQGERVLDLSKGALVPTKPFYRNRSLTRVALTATGTFDLEGSFFAKSEGGQAVEMRSWLRYMTRDEWRIAALQILHDLDPIAQSVGKITRKGLEDLKAPVVLEGKFRIPCQFPGNGEFTFISLERPDLPIRLESLTEKRRGPLMIGQALTKETVRRITLPVGMRVRYAPAETSGSTKGMDWSVKISVTPNGFTYHRLIRLKRGILIPGTDAYHEFIAAVHRLYKPANNVVILEKK